ncbi:hypothetical protein D3C76_1029250 [compost metagenome]
MKLVYKMDYKVLSTSRFTVRISDMHINGWDIFCPSNENIITITIMRVHRFDRYILRRRNEQAMKLIVDGCFNSRSTSVYFEAAVYRDVCGI